MSLRNEWQPVSNPAHSPKHTVATEFGYWCADSLGLGIPGRVVCAPVSEFNRESEVNQARRKALSKIIETLTDLRMELGDLYDEEQAAYDNLPDSLRESEAGQKRMSNADDIDSAINSIDSAISDIESSIGE